MKILKDNKIMLLIIVALIILPMIFFKLKPSIPDNQNWKTYTNVTYGYSIIYPENAVIAKISEEELGPAEQSEAIDVQIPGVGTKFSVVAYLPYKYAPEPLAEEQKNLATLPLPQFTETIRQFQINDDNPNTKDKKVGELKEITLAGQKAYSFTLTKSFNKGLAGGFILPKDITFNFIFVENGEGIKLMTYYPMEDNTSREIVNSFKFNK